MHNIWQKMNQRENPKIYQKKDSHLVRSLSTKDLLALGIGTIVSTTIFTLPGIVSAEYSGPAVIISFLLAAIVAGFIALNYAEMSAAMPFAGSAFSWINVIFGKFWGWLAGWALLAEYFMCVAFIAAGLSSNFRGLMTPIGFHLPRFIATSLANHGGIDIVAVVAILIVAWLLSRGSANMTKVENPLVVLKILAIILFIIVGLTAIHTRNYVPFVPKHRSGSMFGGWQGIYASVSMIFLSYVGFDAIAANSAEAKDPQKTMPRSIIGSLILGAVLFMFVAFVLVGMFKYTNFNNNAEPVGWALRAARHGIVASVVQAIAILGMFTALIGMTLAGSRLIYSFGRDGMIPRWFGKLNRHHLPNRALWGLTIAGIIMGTILPFGFMAQLISAGALIAFAFVSVGIFTLRKREAHDIPRPKFQVPWYPVLPIISLIFLIIVFLGLGTSAKVYSGIWYIVGIIIYFLYGIRHEKNSK